MFKKYRDLILGVFMLVFGAVYTVLAFGIKSKLKPRFNPAYVPVNTIPVALGILMILLAAMLTLSALKKLKTYQPTGTEKSVGKAGVVTVVLTLAVLALYLVLLPNLGFLAATPIFLYLLMLVLAPKAERKHLLFIVIAVAFTVLVFVAFRIGLKQILPRGIIENLLNI